MSTNATEVAVFHTHEKAEAAIRELEKSGFNLKKLSIIGKDYHTEENVVGYYNTGDRMLSWGQNGALWGGLWGLLFGSAFFFLPGVGPVLVAGPLVGWIVGALEGAAIVGGISVLGGALASIGIPENTIVQYESELKIGKFLVIAHGTPEEIARAKHYFDLSKSAVTTVHAEPVMVSA